MLVIGLVLAGLATVGVWSVRRDGAPVEPSPVDGWQEEVAAAPEGGDAVPVTVPAEAEEWAADPEWDLPRTYNERVEYWIDFLKGENYDHTRLWLERLGKYGSFLRAELRARGMPEDLVYLAMIESGLSPGAYSSARASGMWQFIASTARIYDLDITSYVDERRDPIASTRAALDYLQKLYRQFGSWYLAAAGYNSGENRVERILDRHAGGGRGDDALFWRIDQYLPRETRDYVPLMLAAAHIGKDPEKYGFTDITLQEPFRFEAVEVPGATSLGVVARAAEVDYDVVRDLNPHLMREMTPPGQESAVRIPAGRRELFARNFEELSRQDRLAMVDHRVRRGETLSHIARRYDTSVEALRAANGWVQPRRLKAGQSLHVPTAHATSSSRVDAWGVHHVRRGDTLWGIARRYGVSVGELQVWNDLGGRSRILPGQRLRVPSS